MPARPDPLLVAKNMKEDHYFGAVGETQIHPAALVCLLVAVVLLFGLRRRYAFIPLLVASLFIPLSQEVMVAGLHLTISRILLLFAWIRLLKTRHEEGRSGMRWTRLDTVFLAYCLVNAVAYFILWGEFGALVNRLGFLYNALGIYFFMRFFVRDFRDLQTLTKTFAWVLIVLAVFMLNEQATRYNAFSIFGGVPPVTELRGDKLRSQGPFAHPLLAGTVGAALFPLILSLWWQGRKSRKLALIGSLAAAVVAIASMSSTPLLALMAGIFALLMWPMRRQLRWFRWATAAALLTLHLVMKAPVWALISRIDLTGSSSSYHRYELVNQFILRFSEWWLVGTRNTSAWGWDMWDTINSYVAAGTDGGLLTFLLFIAVIAVAFQQLGVARKRAGIDFERARLLWGLGAMLFVHSVAFFGIGYFDQSSILWYTGLAMIGTAVTLKVPLLKAAPAAENPAHSFDCYAQPAYQSESRFAGL